MGLIAVESMPTARISWDGVAGQLELDGHDISRAVNAATLHLGAREVARLDLQLNVMAVEAGHVDHVHLKLYMPDEARELLIRQGWTPPAEEATTDA